MWSMIENNLGIIVACIPPLSPLVRSVRDKSSNRPTGATPGGQEGLGIGSPYALQSIGAKNMKGFVGIGSQNDNSVRKWRSTNTAMGVGDIESSSEELNLSRGIHMTTEVFVSRESIVDNEEDTVWKLRYPYPS
jgi:hypothetical protein